jgi:uncharacterized protein
MTPTPDTNTPLGPEDFDAQDAELDALREQDEEIPQWEFCEGFLAALVCSRRAVAPDEYWPVLLGDDFQPAAHMEFVWRWRRRWAEVAAALDAPVETLDDERTYQPETLDTRGAVLALPESERGETDLAALPAYAQVWALGFMYAVETWPEDWLPPRDSEAAQMLDNALSAIVALTESGLTALWMSRISSGLPIYALSAHRATLRRMTLYRGVHPVLFAPGTTSHMQQAAPT